MSLVYNIAKQKFANGDMDWEANTIKVLLLNSGYTADADHATVDAIISVSNECSGTGYVRKSLANKVSDNDTTNDRTELKADDISWTGLSVGTVAAFLVYQEIDSGNDALNIPIAYINTGGFPTTASGGDVAIAFSADGIIQLT